MFLFSAGLCVFAVFGTGTRFVYAVNAVRIKDPGYPLFAEMGFFAAMATISALGIFACFKFMWDVRHPNVE